MKLKTTTVLTLIALVVFCASCSRGITPWEAANGKAKCGRHIR